MKFLSWFPRILATLIGVLGMIVVVSFALSNRQRVTLDLWPFEASVEPYLILLLGVIFLFGFLIGATVMWVSGGRKRREAREVRRAANSLQRQVSDLEDGKPGDRPAGLPVSPGGNRP